MTVTTGLLRTGLAALVAGLAGLAVAAAAEGEPVWSRLTSDQRVALAPLQRDWSSIDPQRKQKWLEVAARFPKMPAEERERVQTRMAEWARLTPSERASARLQFQEAREISPKERQDRWQAYQALPDDQRRELAQQRAARRDTKPAPAVPLVDTRLRSPAPSSSASATASVADTSAAKAGIATRATSPGRAVVQAGPGATTTTIVTRPAPPPHHQPGLPKIAATPGFVDPATLLPRRGPQGAAAVREAAASEPSSAP